ncbi:MAG: T9SS type A sorting domain-containing protein [Methanosarcinales archaeon]|nr:T9SS type A sorting domain-containing protein [Methanosarcinales archaeon]
MKLFITLSLLLTTSILFSQNASHACANNKIHFHNSISQNNFKAAGTDDYDMKYVELDLEVTNLSKYIEGSCTHKVEVTNTTNNFVFQLSVALTVSSVTVNGLSAAYTHTADLLTINSSYTYQAEDLVDIKIYYSGIPPAGGGFSSGTGLFNATSSWGTRVTWTLSEPYSSYTWWPTKQDLDDKIDSTKFTFTTLDSLKVGSNGLLIEETLLPYNKIKYVWKSNYPIAYYLISFAVANYDEYSFKVLIPGASDSLLVQNYIYKDPAYLPYYELEILETGKMLIDFSEKFGMYPFIDEKYGHCIAPLGGGMEHQTMTTQAYFSNWLTAHELGHQWWGNNVTCSTWGDLWINEGFASYTEYIYSQYLETQADADADMLYRHSHIMSSPDGSVYVEDVSSFSTIFDSRLVYDKGAAVVHMIRNMINDDALFFQTLRAFQDKFKDNTAGTADLDEVILDETGIDLTDFFDSWIYGEGYPIYSGKYNTKNDTVFVMVSQKSSMIGSTQLYIADLELKLFFNDGTDSIVRVASKTQHDGFYYLIDKEIDSLKVDPNNWIINKSEDFVYDPQYSFPVISNIYNITESNLIIVNNPFSNLLNIKFKEKNISNLNITNSLGQLVYANDNIKSNIEVNTSNWAKGIYFISIDKNNKKHIKKVVKE